MSRAKLNTSLTILFSEQAKICPLVIRSNVSLGGTAGEMEMKPGIFLRIAKIIWRHLEVHATARGKGYVVTRGEEPSALDYWSRYTITLTEDDITFNVNEDRNWYSAEGLSDAEFHKLVARDIRRAYIAAKIEQLLS